MYFFVSFLRALFGFLDASFGGRNHLLFCSHRAMFVRSAATLPEEPKSPTAGGKLKIKGERDFGMPSPRRQV
jgi:hypothetical protein